MIKRILFLTFIFGTFFAFNNFSQDTKNSTEKKILVIIDNKTQKLWTQSQLQDSIKWDKVKAVNTLPDTTAVRKYGKKGINGAIIIQYNQITLPNKPPVK